MILKHSVFLIIAILLIICFSYWFRSRSVTSSSVDLNPSIDPNLHVGKERSAEIFQNAKNRQGQFGSERLPQYQDANQTTNRIESPQGKQDFQTQIDSQDIPQEAGNFHESESPPEKTRSQLEVEYNFVDIADKMKFLKEHRIHDPAKIKLSLPDIKSLEIVSQHISGKYSGLLQHPDHTVWQINFDINGSIHDEHLEGFINLDVVDENMITIMQSHLKGSIDQHLDFKRADGGTSITILPNPDHPSQVIQLFLELDQSEVLIGNFYIRKSSGQFSEAIPMVLERLSGQ